MGADDTTTVGPWVPGPLGGWQRWSAVGHGDMMASVHPDAAWLAWHASERGGHLLAERGPAPTLDAAKAAADAALEAAGYVLEGGAHVDPGARERAGAELVAALAKAHAEVERLTRERDEVAKALGDRWVAGRPMMDKAGPTVAWAEAAPATVAALARLLRCEPDGVEGAALALREEVLLLRGWRQGVEAMILPRAWPDPAKAEEVDRG